MQFSAASTHKCALLLGTQHLQAPHSGSKNPASVLPRVHPLFLILILVLTFSVFDMAYSAAVASRLPGQTAALSLADRQHATAGSAFSSSLRTSTFTPAGFRCQSKKCVQHSRVVCALAEQTEDALELKVQRRSIMAAAVALTAALVGETFASGNAKADIQKVEGAVRDEQDAVTQGRREPSTLGRGAGNTVQEAGRVNAQASGGTITGAPKMEKPGGAYRSPQSDTLTIGADVDSKKSSPAGILQGKSPGKSAGQNSSPV